MVVGEKRAFSRAEIRDKIVRKIKILLLLFFVFPFFFRTCYKIAGEPQIVWIVWALHSLFSLKPIIKIKKRKNHTKVAHFYLENYLGKIGVRNASETTTELLKYPKLSGPLSGPWTPAVMDFALRARVVCFAHKNDGILTFPINWIFFLFFLSSPILMPDSYSLVIVLFQMAAQDIHHVLFWQAGVDEPSIQLRCPPTRMEMITRCIGQGWELLQTLMMTAFHLKLLASWDVIWRNNLRNNLRGKVVYLINKSVSE